MTGPVLYPPMTPAVLDATLATLARHVPADVEVGIPFAAALQPHDDGTRAVLVLTRAGGWTVTGRWAERTRRLDSELAELWDTSGSGRYDFVTWSDGVETHRAERIVELQQ